ncbi:hypothetical protein KAR91_06270 [Candidatus Pacearchaeota archaeon]|nr:hypothetical protein [Candidatus Pacearchaeota archaeon]
MIKSKVLQRFNEMDPGTIFDCPKEKFKSFKASGLIEEVKESKKKVQTSPKDKQVKGSNKK